MPTFLSKARIVLGAIVLLAIGIFLARTQLERVVVAYRIHKAHVFSPPPPVAGESSWSRSWKNAQFYWDSSQLHVARERRLKELEPELRPLVKEIARRQAAGEGMQYSMHTYREIRWRLNFTPDIETTRARIADLRRSLDRPDLQKLAAEQDPSDGSWGMGINVWYLRLYYSVEDGLDNRTADPQYPLLFLDRINSPEKLNAQLDSDLYDDFTRTGEFKREELDETFSALARLLFGHKRTGYTFDPGLADALRTYVKRWQNPASGCWGQWVLDRHGRVWKMDDMAMTFHVVSDFHGQVEHLDLIAGRLLQLDGAEFPAGIRFDGHYENHLNWDAVRIFRYAWPSLDEPARETVRAEIQRMLEWCLTNSYQPDGSFKVSDLDDTLGDAYSYGVAFLRDTGYLRPDNRFWTTQNFPDAPVVRDRIEAKIKSIGTADPGLKDAYEVLQASK